LRVQEKGLSLAFELGADVPRYVHADQSKLRQILINLLGNAVKFTKNGKITLRVKNRELAKGAQAKACILHFEVTDTGVGIAPQEQEQIFDPFFQSDGRQSHQEGTGLGLSISQRFADMMGNGLKVNSDAGRGTTFSFTVRAGLTQDPQTLSSQFKRRVIGLEAGQMMFRLLVVEDDASSRHLMVNLLRSVGFSVEAAVNGREAVEIWGNWQPHLIWMDIRMPVTDGYEAISRIKSEMGQSTFEIDTKIIALSASAFEENRLKVMAHGANDFVRKPFREQEIFEKLQKHLGVRYVYEEKEADLTVVVPSKKMSIESLIAFIKGLPGELTARLQEAIELSDAAMIDGVIEEIRSEDAQLAEALSEMAGNFAYDQMLVLIERAGEVFVETQGQCAL
jgi:CheY-like chemotaxis protein